jgi:ElaB/YqjD/DUF883 family membrane-anchored ribosome-binding protein
MNYEKENEKIYDSTSAVSNQASRVVDETKKLGEELYEQGKEQLKSVQDELTRFSDKLTKKIHQQPLTSVLWAAGIGFILAKLTSNKD